MLDNSVFVAAITNPTRRTATLRLILHLIEDDEMRIIGDKYLGEEMIRYAEVYASETASSLLEAIASKMVIVDVEVRFLKICREYMGTTDLSDVYHAAACLQTNSTLISDDHHFDRVRGEGIIKVLSSSEAIREFLGI